MADVTNALMELAEQDYELADDPALLHREGEIIERKDAKVLPMAVETASGQWVTLYHTITRQPHIINKNNAGDAQRRLHNDPTYPDMIGKPVFSKVSPGPVQWGQERCWLFPGVEKCSHCGKAHDPAPGAELRAKQGFPICLSAHLASPFHVERHMKLKHSSSYEAMMLERENERRERQEELQRQQIAALLAMGQRQSAVEEVVAPQHREKAERPMLTEQCPECGVVIESTLQMALNGKMKAHRKTHEG